MSDNLDEIINKIKNNTAEENKALANNLQDNLNAEQSAMLNGLLSDSELMKKLMASDAVKNIINKIGGESNGHQ